MTNYANVTNDEIVAALPVAHNIFKPIQKAIDHVTSLTKGRLLFDDIRDAVSIYVDRDINPALFEACVRVAECTNVVTIPASDYK